MREASRQRTLHVSARKKQSPARQRYGSANEPMPHLIGGQQGVMGNKDAAAKKETSRDATPKPKQPARSSPVVRRETAHEEEEDDEGLHVSGKKAAAPAKSSSASSSSAAAAAKHGKDDPVPRPGQAEEQPAIEALPPKIRVSRSPATDATESRPLAGPSPKPQIHAKPLETVLNMAGLEQEGGASKVSVYEPANPSAQSPFPSKDQEANNPNPKEDQPLEARKPPHISTPPYIHHFDTFSLVRRLEKGGWTQPQSITLMKAVRQILSENMTLAQQGLVSKSDVENTTYLFNAACSELRTEIQTKRKTEAERSRSERTALSHEVDILSQRMTQESATMKDELKGMFDDRKMAVRNEQRDMERKLQELNYKITIHLNSDSRSDVEGVRWIITKRAITALAICVAMILGSIKFASSVAQWEEEERKLLAASRNNKGDGSPKAEMRDAGTDPMGGDAFAGQGEILVRQGDNPAFVSLG